MKRSEAEKLINTPVTAWTAMNGEYIGILREVKGSPWRAVVEITGVIRPAVVYEIGRSTQRRGFRVGEMIEVGGSSCRPVVDEQGSSYLEALQAELKRFQEWNARPSKSPKENWLGRAIQDVERAIVTETKRLKEDQEMTKALPPVDNCECDNTHYQNQTVCMPCFDAGIRFDTAYWPEHLKTAKQPAPTQHEKLVAAAQSVIDNWESGDLALQVRRLASALAEIQKGGEL